MRHSWTSPSTKIANLSQSTSAMRLHPTIIFPRRTPSTALSFIFQSDLSLRIISLPSIPFVDYDQTSCSSLCSRDSPATFTLISFSKSLSSSCILLGASLVGFDNTMMDWDRRNLSTWCHKLNQWNTNHQLTRLGEFHQCTNLRSRQAHLYHR